MSQPIETEESDEDLTECPRCGTMQPDVEVRDDPYLWELYGHESKFESCKNCWQQRKDDI